MGQRLVLNFTQDGKSIATLYQHWSGYTLSAFSTLQEISEYGSELGLFKEQDTISKIKALAETMTDLYFDDIAYSEDEAPFLTKYLFDPFKIGMREPIRNRRTDGIVSFSRNAMQNKLDWAEMLIDIDIESWEFDLGILFWQADQNEWKSEIEPYEEITFEKAYQTSETYPSVLSLTDAPLLEEIGTQFETQDFCLISGQPDLIYRAVQ